MLEVNKRTVQRYIHLLEELGFNIDRDFENRFYIFDSDQVPQLSFTPQETTAMKRMIMALPDSHPLKSGMAEKLYVQSSVEILGTEFYKSRISRLLTQLEKAIDENRKSVLCKYHSAQGNSITDRLVHPLRLTDEFQYLIAREEKSRTIKTFKIERISDVLLLEETFETTTISDEWMPDLFGISGQQSYQVLLKMKLRAYLLMREEVPGAIPFLRRERTGDETVYFFEGYVKGWEGISRFIRGLNADIQVIHPKELQSYLKDRGLAENGLNDSSG